MNTDKGPTQPSEWAMKRARDIGVVSYLQHQWDIPITEASEGCKTIVCDAIAVALDAARAKGRTEASERYYIRQQPTEHNGLVTGPMGINYWEVSIDIRPPIGKARGRKAWRIREYIPEDAIRVGLKYELELMSHKLLLALDKVLAPLITVSKKTRKHSDRELFGDYAGENPHVDYIDDFDIDGGDE